jgi:ketosteroid isomerase-like protein
MKASVILAFLAFAALVQAQQKLVQERPAHSHSEIMKRGEQGMGFSQQTTTHHFRLLADGGAIEIETKDPKDTGTRDQIRQHLSHIAKMFSDGNFEIPMFIHDKTPPGVPTMTELRDEIHYDFEPMGSGARVRIHTRNARAMEAVREFLRFQIAEHQTGDPTSPQSHPAK